MEVKNIIVLAIAVFAGIWLYRKMVAAPKKAGGAGAGTFSGPDVDPDTGAYLPPGAQPATVEFSAQGN